jgi:hypothetical protein
MIRVTFTPASSPTAKAVISAPAVPSVIQVLLGIAPTFFPTRNAPQWIAMETA